MSYAACPVKTGCGSAVQTMVENQRGMLKSVAPAAAPSPEVKRWVRGPDGKPVRVQDGGNAGAPVRRRYNPATGQIE